MKLTEYVNDDYADGYAYFRVQVTQEIPVIQVLTRVLEVEVKVPRKCTDDKLIELACNIGEAEAKDVDFTETIDFESEDMVENETEYYSPAQGKFGIIKATKSDKPKFDAVDVVERSF